MTPRTVKVAISLPAEKFRQVERMRKERKLSRSAAIAEALSRWIDDSESAKKIRAYVEGYRRRPEAQNELRTLATLGAQVLAAEEWKD
jgi:metal-responsive CopG/Arc/MetJ family transcriptional regulator